LCASWLLDIPDRIRYTRHPSRPLHASDVLLFVRVQSTIKCPEEVKLSRENGEALRQRLAGDTLTATDRRVLALVLQWYFWLLFALQEATFSLKRLRVLLFGAKPHTRKTTPPPGTSSHAVNGPGGMGSAPAQGMPDATEATDAGR